MIGIGLTPEGIGTNDVIYEYMLENNWRKENRNVHQWYVQYDISWSPLNFISLCYFLDLRVKSIFSYIVGF